MVQDDLDMGYVKVVPIGSNIVQRRAQKGHLRESLQNAVKEDVKSWSAQRECTRLKQVKKRNPGVTAVA